MKRPPVTKSARQFEVAKLITKLSAKKISNVVTFKNEQEGQQDLAKLLFEGLCQLRGSALKIAQVICGDEGLLPDVYIRELKKSQYRVPPINRALVRDVIKKELGDYPEKLFKQFDLEAMAAASLGQVHRATLDTGESVVLKIQYPGIDISVKSDFDLGRMFIRKIPNSGQIQGLLTEIEKNMIHELDYQYEKEQIEYFKKVNKNLNIHIPEVFDKYSTSKVLCLSFEKGLHLEEWLAEGPSQHEIDVAAQNLYDFFYDNLFNKHVLHSDPNQGNFLFQKDGRVVVIDYGSIKKLSPDAVVFYKKLLSFKGKKDIPDLLKLYKSFGATLSTIAEGEIRVEDNQKFVDEIILPFCNWIQVAFLNKSFDFKNDSLFTKGKLSMFSSQIFHPQMQNFNPELTYVHRTFLGLLQIFSKMKANVRFYL